MCQVDAFHRDDQNKITIKTLEQTLRNATLSTNTLKIVRLYIIFVYNATALLVSCSLIIQNF